MADREYSYVIAYWSESKDVLWTGGTNRNKEATIYYAMERYLAYGQATEILEVGYYNSRDYSDGAQPYNRCNYWRDQLRNQGYDIRRPR